MMTSLILSSGDDPTKNMPLGGSLGPLFPTSYDVVWSLVAFFLILLLMWKFVLPRYGSVLRERQERIEGGIEKADALQAKARLILDEYNKQLALAHDEASTIREQARDQGRQIIAEMTEKAQAESARIVASGQQTLAAQRQLVFTDLKNDIGAQATELAEVLLRRQLDDDSQRATTIDTFLDQLDEGVGAGRS